MGLSHRIRLAFDSMMFWWGLVSVDLQDTTRCRIVEAKPPNNHVSITMPVDAWNVLYPVVETRKHWRFMTNRFAGAPLFTIDLTTITAMRPS